MMAKILNGRRGAYVKIEDYGERFVVTGSNGSTDYFATLPACLRDECRSGAVVSCVRPVGARGQHPVNGSTSVNAWLKHVATHCHGWHWPSVEAFAGRVLDTYGTGARRSAVKAGVGKGALRPRDFVPTSHAERS